MAEGVLFVHTNFPAQFRDLVESLLARGVPVRAISANTAPVMPQVRTARYGLSRGTTPGIFVYAVRPEADLLRATAALRGARSLKAEGFEPQVIVGHSGWGETALLKEAWPDAKQVLYPEFFYRGRGLDIDFDNEFIPLTEEGVLLGKTKNSVMSLALTDATAIVCPTPFQASTLPSIFQPRVRVIHEGIDVDAIAPAPAAPFPLDDGRVIAPGTPVITHINNQMEPLRGLHIFLRALPRVLEAVPDAQVLVIGDEKARGYGGNAPEGKTWKQVCLEGVEDRIDMSRVHFLGRVAHGRMHDALRLSSAHVYYTYPFVLSWSLAEAMALGCYVIGSDTPPVRDAIEDGMNGRLLPFFDVDALSEALIEACRNPEATRPLRAAARETPLERFSRAKGRQAWLDLLREMDVEIPA
ncbi:glycosyltransferase [Phenylobacterium sp.]|uniref:glycosyltransferase n=1 Tax=Phenylobacterium sp. TaxID=1871053 RepID=UPI002F94D792